MQYDFIKQELTGTCIICGEPSLPETVCDKCNSTECSGRKIPIPNVLTKNACDLAGNVIKLCLNEYKGAYRKRLENPYREKYKKDFENLNEEFRGGYYQALSMGKMDDFLDCARREVERDINGK